MCKLFQDWNSVADQDQMQSVEKDSAEWQHHVMGREASPNTDAQG